MVHNQLSRTFKTHTLYIKQRYIDNDNANITKTMIDIQCFIQKFLQEGGITICSKF